MVTVAEARSRVSVSGKFFRLDGQKFYAKGVSYGPFAPNGHGGAFASPEVTARDFQLARDLGVNLLRIYHVPPPWFLALAQDYGLKLLVDIPWDKQTCVLDSTADRDAVGETIRQAVKACAGHPAIFAFSVANEIPADIVRWSGAEAVADFIDELVGIAHAEDPQCLCTFGNFPPTEYLRPRDIDFWCFNVYLHETKPLENYLARLQMISDTKPLILGEFGVDSIREGEERQRLIVSAGIEMAFRAGLAGMVIYSFTDEWFKDGQEILDWGLGLCDRQRMPKPAFFAVRDQFAIAPYYPLPRTPSVSVVVGCYNGGRTLKACLESLEKLRYPDFEVIVVDDGSTDDTAQVASAYKSVRLIQHTTNMGLSVARNTGIEASRGEIIAFTDADCRVDEDWLYYVVGDLLRGNFAGMGGHNLLPPDDSWIAAAVMVSPGGPAHVMKSDRLAEHIPGCNMAFYAWALRDIGGFDPMFRKAGDDVDVCWRLLERGLKIGFSPAGFVWHYRRSTVGAYLRQQYGYGEAEALLVRKHPERFNWFGGGIWQGRIYSPAKFGLLFNAPRIYYGPFGSGMFQSLYAAQPELAAMLFTSLEYMALVVLPLAVLAFTFVFLVAPTLTAALLPVAVCVAAAAQANLSATRRRFWSRPLVALLYFLQPLVRGWARYQGRLTFHAKPLAAHESLDSLNLRGQGLNFEEMAYWAEHGIERAQFLQAIMTRLDREDWLYRPDPGWNACDVEIVGSRWNHLHLLTVSVGNKSMIRCRLRAKWNFMSRALFCAVAVAELVLIGLWGVTPIWHWAILASLLGLAGWFWHQNRNLQRVVSVFLDEVAKSLNMVKLESGRSEPKPAGGQ